MATTHIGNDPPSSSGFLCSPQREVYQHDIHSDFKRLVVQLAGALDDEESRVKIRYLQKDKLGHGWEAMKALEILQRLEEKGAFSARNVQPLEALLRDMDRCDLIGSHLEPYREKYAGSQLSRAGDRAVLHHSMSTPQTSSLSHNHQPVRYPSVPVAITTYSSKPSMKSIDMTSIEEEHGAMEDWHNPATHVSQTSLLVSGTFSSKIKDSPNLSRVGVSLQKSQHANSIAEVGRECTEPSNVCASTHSVPSDAGQKCDKLDQDNDQFFQPLKQDVSFEVGGEKSTPSTLPRDIESQFNFPMDDTLPSQDNSPTEVRSKLTNPNPAEGLSNVLTRSLQQMDEWTHLSTPLPSTDKTSVEATNHGDGGACFIPGQTKPHPQLNPGLPVVPKMEKTRETDQIQQPSLPVNGAASLGATTSVQCPPLDRTWFSKPATFLLKREKMALMISRQKTTHYSCFGRRFNVAIPISGSKKGMLLTLKVFPYSRDGDRDSRHAALVAYVSYPRNDSKCQELVGNCYCAVKANITFVNYESHIQMCTKEGESEFDPTSCEACIRIDQALSHEDILYSRTKYIQLQVEAVLRCTDKVVAVPSPEFPEYLKIETPE